MHGSQKRKEKIKSHSQTGESSAHAWSAATRALGRRVLSRVHLRALKQRCGCPCSMSNWQSSLSFWLKACSVICNPSLDEQVAEQLRAEGVLCNLPFNEYESSQSYMPARAPCLLPEASFINGACFNTVSVGFRMHSPPFFKKTCHGFLHRTHTPNRVHP